MNNDNNSKQTIGLEIISKAFFKRGVEFIYNKLIPNEFKSNLASYSLRPSSEFFKYSLSLIFLCRSFMF